MSKDLHKELAKILSKECSINHSDTYEFLNVIDAAKNLVGFKQILENLLEILPLLESVDSEEWDAEKTTRLVAVCNACLDQKNKIYFLIIHNNKKKEDLFNKNTVNTPKSLHGPIVSNPLYSSLWSQRTIQKTSFLHLQAQFMNAFYQYTMLEGDEKEYESSKKSFSFLIREMHNNHYNDELLLLIPKNSISTQKLYDKIFFKKIQDEDLKKRHRNLTRFLAFSLAISFPSSRYTKEDNVTQNMPVVTTQYEDPDTELEPELLQVIKTSTNKNSVATASYNLGNSNDETFSGPSFFKTKKRVKSEEGETIRETIRENEQKSRAIATNNQHLPFQWSRLNLIDFISLLTGIEELASQSNNKSTELAALLSIMLWTSSSYERAIDIRVSKLIPRSKGNELYYCSDDSSWCIQSPTLKQRNMGKEWRQFLEQIDHSIELPCISSTSSYIKKVIRAKRITPSKKSRRLFTDDLEDQVRDFVSKQNKANTSRLTKARISSYLFHLLSDKTGDAGDAALITGNTPTSGQSTSLYYYAPKSDLLAEKYTKLCNELIGVINPQLVSRIERLESLGNLNITSSNRVGSHICPLMSTIKLMVEDLKNMLDCRNRDRTDPTFLIELHNAYTAYSVMLFGFTTGYRAVNDPFYSVMDVDWESQFVTISDKDNDDNYNTRIVWLPEITISQLRYYEEHRKQLIEEMVFLNPVLANKLKRKETLTWKAQLNNEDGVPFFFFLNERYKAIKVGPISLKKNVKWSYELPQNTNRHFLRTKLREYGVDGEVVDIFMGHWETGQEPHNQFSTLSPQDYKSILEEDLTNILQDTGWIKIRGF